MPTLLRYQNGLNWQPSMLVSYVNLAAVMRNNVLDVCDEWVLDSGAYSAATSGKEIDLNKYIDDCHRLMKTKKPPKHIFGLDVIGDPEASAKNIDEMRRQGVDALATFHYGSPYHYLKDVSAYGKMAFGGLVQRGAGGHGTRLDASMRLRFLENCFSRIDWPVWIHGFGCCDHKILLKYPLASADSTSWVYSLQRYGHLQYLKVNNANIRESRDKATYTSCLIGQIEHFRTLEQQTRDKWRRLHEKLGLGEFRLRFVASGKTDRTRFETYKQRRSA